ncbi:MAG: chloride channel protein [Actinomycetota bacterium]
MEDTAPRRLALLTVLAAALGLAGGAAAVLLLRLIGLITNLALFHRVGTDIPSFADWQPGLLLVPAAMAGGLAVSLLARRWPVIRGHGIPETMEAVLLRQSRISPGVAVAKPVSAAVSIGTGGPFGAEGPIIVTGGAMGSLVGQFLHVSPAERKILLACGAAAGMAATFGAPLAAVILAFELLLFEFSTRALVPLVVASSVAAGVHSQAFGSGPLFDVPAGSFAGLERLPIYVVVGLACGLFSVLVTRGLFLVEGAYRRLPVGECWHPVIGAGLFAVVGLAVPQALGVGYDAIGDVLANRYALGALCVIGGAKLLAWWLALGSGTSGGTLAPLLLVGGAFGAILGELGARAFPGLGIPPGAVALVAMAAVFGSATGATFAAVVFLFELTRDYNVVLPLMLATVLAHLVARALLKETLMTEKLVRRGVPVHTHYEADVLRTTRVSAVMTRAVETLRADATVGDALARFGSGPHHHYPLVDPPGRCLGMATWSDLLRDPSASGARLLDLVDRDVATVLPTDTVLTAVRRMLEAGVDALAVVDRHRRLEGICTRTDILRARTRQFDQERRQEGWLRVWTAARP